MLLEAITISITEKVLEYLINNNFCILWLRNLMRPLSIFCPQSLSDLLPVWRWLLRRLRGNTGHLSLPAVIPGLPIHSPLVPWQKVHLCAGSQSYHGTHGQSCSARPFPNWVLQMGDPSWRPCTITMSPFSRSSRCLWLKHNQAKHCNQHSKHQKGKAALPVTEKQTAQDKLHYRDKIRISFV